MMKIRWLGVVLVVMFSLCFLGNYVDCLAQDPTDCDLVFDGVARKNIKMRKKSTGANYIKINNGNAITVTQFFDTTCRLDENVPNDISNTKSIVGVENRKVTVEGFLVAAKFEGDADQDIHAELSHTTSWNSPHMVIEIPPGPAYCIARKLLWGLVKTDGPIKNSKRIMTTPIKIRVKGYVFLDATHGSEDRCEKNGGRGLRKDGAKSKVKGLYEIHPVLSVEVVP
jgi:hypothetical protein